MKARAAPRAQWALAGSAGVWRTMCAATGGTSHAFGGFAATRMADVVIGHYGDIGWTGGIGMIVKTIQTEGAVVHIDDDVLRGLTPAQLQRNLRRTRAVAAGIAYRAMLRGEVEGLTPEEWQRRYGGELT